MFSFLLAACSNQKQGSPTDSRKTATPTVEEVPSLAKEAPSPVKLPVPKAPKGMKLVPGGSFTMGLNHPRAIPDEKTEHRVTVAPFYLDVTEVTNQAYNQCVTAGVCRSPKPLETEKQGFGPSRFFLKDDHPVVGVSQRDAITFCKWMQKRLPTEAEFERAARGDDGRLYAWGNEPPTSSRARYAEKTTSAVGTHPEGAGPYGHLDLAGNVWEWTSDLYDPRGYERETAHTGKPADCETIKKTQDDLRRQGLEGFTGTNPIPRECDTVLRGGAFNYFSWGLRASNRVHHPATWRMTMAGFRCAKDMDAP